MSIQIAGNNISPFSPDGVLLARTTRPLLHSVARYSWHVSTAEKSLPLVSKLTTLQVVQSTSLVRSISDRALFRANRLFCTFDTSMQVLVEMARRGEKVDLGDFIQDLAEVGVCLCGTSRIGLERS